MKHTQREKQRAKKTLHNHCRYSAGRLQLLHQGHESVFVGGRLSALLPPRAVVKKGIEWWQGILPLRTHTPLKEGRETLCRGGRRSARKTDEDPNRKQTEQAPKRNRKPHVGPPRANPQPRNTKNRGTRVLGSPPRAKTPNSPETL